MVSWGCPGNRTPPELGLPPVVRLAPRRGQFPLRRAGADSVPGEDQPLELAGRQQVQPGGFGRRRIGRRDAPAGRVVFVAVERAYEAAVPHPAAGLGPEVGAEMGARRARHAEPPVPVAPGDDPPAQPGLSGELPPLQRRPARDEVPALRKRIERGLGLVEFGHRLRPRRTLSGAGANGNRIVRGRHAELASRHDGRRRIRPPCPPVVTPDLIRGPQVPPSPGFPGPRIKSGVTTGGRNPR